MVDGVPGYHGGAGDPPCYNCGIRGHWFNACPEPARKIPAGLEASLAAKQNPRDGTSADGAASNSRRGKGPVITRYPLPPTPVSSISHYDPPSGVSLPPQPPAPPGYQAPPSYHHPYGPSYGAPIQHFDPYHHSSALPPPPPPPPGAYNHYPGPSNPYGPPPPGPPYRPLHDLHGGYAHDHGRPRPSPPYSYSSSHLPPHHPPPPPLPPHHYSYPLSHDYPRPPSTYSDAHAGFHGSPPPHDRHSRYSPPPYHREAYGRDRSPREQSRDSWPSRHYRQSENEGHYRGRDYGRDRPRYSPREASPHRQRQGQDQSPPHRSAAVERRGRHERRRDDPPGGSNGSNNRKGDRSQSKQTNSKVSEKQNERPRADKAQRQQRQSASDTKAPAPDGEILQWGLVVPYMPVWDFEEAEATDSKVESRGDRPFEEDDDFEWMLGQLFADWVPYYQSRPISKPLPQEYSEEDIPSPNGYDDVLQTEYITATNVDHFALSIRDTKEWRIKKWFPLWADPLDIHPRMLARLADHDKQSREQSAREGSQHASMKANGRPPADKANQGDKTKIAGVRSPHEALVAPSPDKHGKGDAKRSLSGNNSFVQRLEQDDRQHDVHLKRYNSSRQSPPDNRQAQLFKAHEDEQQRPANYEHASANNESRGSKGQLSDRQGLSEENSTTSIDTFKHKHSLDRDARGPRTQVGIEQDTIKVASPHESTVRHTCETNDPERPSSRGSLRSWHSRGRVSRQASIVSELSHPESPLTPTEMALLGIEGSDDDDSDSDSEKGGKAKVSLTPPPPPTPQRQKQAHRKGDDVSATKSSRALKRQAPTATVEETTPRTKKRRQQVASAFNRRW